MGRLASDLDFLDDGPALSEEEVIAPTPVRVARLYPRTHRARGAASRMEWVLPALAVGALLCLAVVAGLAVLSVIGWMMLG